MKQIDDAFRALTDARDTWMMHHNDDWDADYFAGLFEDARISLERINENCSWGQEDNV